MNNGDAVSCAFNEVEWRMIHNGLSALQNQTTFMQSFTAENLKRRREIQEVMNKVRDHCIRPYATSHCPKCHQILPECWCDPIQ